MTAGVSLLSIFCVQIVLLYVPEHRKLPNQVSSDGTSKTASSLHWLTLVACSYLGVAEGEVRHALGDAVLVGADAVVGAAQQG